MSVYWELFLIYNNVKWIAHVESFNSDMINISDPMHDEVGGSDTGGPMLAGCDTLLDLYVQPVFQ